VRSDARGFTSPYAVQPDLQGCAGDRVKRTLGSTAALRLQKISKPHGHQGHGMCFFFWNQLYLVRESWNLGKATPWIPENHGKQNCSGDPRADDGALRGGYLLKSLSKTTNKAAIATPKNSVTTEARKEIVNSFPPNCTTPKM